MHILLMDKIVQNCLQRQADGDCPTVDSFPTEMLEDCITQLDANQQSLNRLHETAQDTIEQQAAKIVKLEAGRERVLNSNTKVAAECEELREQVAMLRDWFKKDNACTCETCWSCAGKGAAVLSQSSDTWLAEHDAEVRRKVLKEAAAYIETAAWIDDAAKAYSVALRRMAEA